MVNANTKSVVQRCCRFGDRTKKEGAATSLSFHVEKEGGWGVGGDGVKESCAVRLGRVLWGKMLAAQGWCQIRASSNEQSDMEEVGLLHREKESHRSHVPPEVGAVGAGGKTFSPSLLRSSRRRWVLPFRVGRISDWLPLLLFPSRRFLPFSGGRSFDWFPAVASAARRLSRIEFGGEIVRTVLRPPKLNYLHSAVFARKNPVDEGQRPLSCGGRKEEDGDIAYSKVSARSFGLSSLT